MRGLFDAYNFFANLLIGDYITICSFWISMNNTRISNNYRITRNIKIHKSIRCNNYIAAYINMSYQSSVLTNPNIITNNWGSFSQASQFISDKDIWANMAASTYNCFFRNCNRTIMIEHYSTTNACFSRKIETMCI